MARYAMALLTHAYTGVSELVTGDEFTVAFFTFVTISPCDDFTVTSYRPTTDVYSTLH